MVQSSDDTSKCTLETLYCIWHVQTHTGHHKQTDLRCACVDTPASAAKHVHDLCDRTAMTILAAVKVHAVCQSLEVWKLTCKPFL